jgi:hypothetical protein
MRRLDSNLLVALVAFIPVGACFSSSKSAPSVDASTPVDSSTSPDASPDSPLVGPDSGVSAADAEAGVELPDASDATADSPASASPADAGPVDAADATTVNCADWDAPVETDASQTTGVPPSLNAEGGAPLPGPAPSVCSLTGDIHAPLEVVNDAPCPIDVWWVGYNCEEQYFSTVAPNGGTWFNDTWETNPWRIRQTGSEVLLVEIPPVPEGVDASLRVVTYP